MVSGCGLTREELSYLDQLVRGALPVTHPNVRHWTRQERRALSSKLLRNLQPRKETPHDRH